MWNDDPVHADDQVAAGVSAELATFLRETVDDQPARIAAAMCEHCQGRVFLVLLNESAAQRECAACGEPAFVADSADYWDAEFWQDDEPGAAQCPCGGERFEVAVAFSLTDDGEVRWVTIGLRCEEDGTSAVYADWTIDYSPSAHLLAMS